MISATQHPKPTDWHFPAGDGPACDACELPLRHLTRFTRSHRAATAEERDHGAAWLKRRASSQGWQISMIPAQPPPKPIGPRRPPGPTRRTLDRMRAVAALVAKGMTHKEAGRALDVHKETVRQWKRLYPAVWQEAIRHAASAPAVDGQAAAEWHVIPDAGGSDAGGDRPPDACPVCGCPASRLSRVFREHRRAADGDGPGAAWVKRRPTAAGWKLVAIARPRDVTPDQERPAAPPPEPRRGPTARTREKMRMAAAMLARGDRPADVARLLELGPQDLKRWRRVHRDAWQEEVDRAYGRAGVDPPPPPAKPDHPGQAPPDPSPYHQEMLRRAIRTELDGRPLVDAADAIGVTRKTLYRLRERYAHFWNVERMEIKNELEAAGQLVQSGLSPATRKSIRQATSLLAAGLEYGQVAEAMATTAEILRYWKSQYAAFWDVELDRAFEAACAIVARQAGTAAVLEDADGFIRRATAADKWARARGRDIFPPGEKPTLATFYRKFYLPNRLFEASPATIEGYEAIVRRWKLIIGDPPLDEITVETLTCYRDCLAKMQGMKPGTRASANTVRRALVHVQAVLDKAGPPGYRNRDAVGILERTPPWIKKPSAHSKPVRMVTPDELSAVYRAAVAMEIPAGLGFKPPAWWRALLVVVYSTGIRRRTVLELRMDEVDWERHALVLPAERLKGARAQVKHLNATAMEHLRKIRGNRELVFEYPYTIGHFNDAWHRLLGAAGIPRERHFGLHDIRKTLGTILWADSPQAAQATLGHRDARTTVNHYVDVPSIEARALDALPIPEAFTAGLGVA
jgi:integrase/transposase-like protein